MEKESKPAEQKPANQDPVSTEDKKGGEVVAESKHSNNKVLVIVLVVIGALVLLGVLGSVLLATVFKKAADTAIEDITGTTMTTDGDTTTIKSSDGTVTASTEQKLPSDFPTTIPLYANQKITGSYKQKTTTGNYWQVTTETSDEISKVVSSVKEAYSKSPWESEAEVESDGSYTLSYAKTGYKVTVFVTKNSSTTMTDLTYTVTQETATE